MNNVQTAINAIRNCNTTDELSQIYEAFKLQRNFISRTAIRSLMVGDTVKFDRGPRRGGWVTGEVIKINTKNVKVKTSAGIWNVAATLLTQVNDTVEQ
jgi:hypothetical protein